MVLLGPLSAKGISRAVGVGFKYSFDTTVAPAGWRRFFSRAVGSLEGGRFKFKADRAAFLIGTSAFISSFSTTAGSNKKLKMSDQKHSTKKTEEFQNLKITVLPATADNFMYLITDKETNKAFIVDPVDYGGVLEEVSEQQVSLQGILTTHHHWDHAGGNEALVKEFEKMTGDKLPVYGGDDRIGALTNQVHQGDTIKLGSLEFECLFTPCHTTGHICYYLKSNNPAMQKPAVFTGDTLFIAGCGRFFEGTPQQMHSALIEKLANLPDETLVFCGHEYTVNNLKFALSVEPENVAANEKMQWACDQRKTETPTVPSTIGEEKLFNPFMRCVQPHLQQQFAAEDAVSLMGKLRRMKDSFKA